MMNERYAVWLTSEGARLFLGLDAPEPRTRWVVVGDGTGEEPGGVGFWLLVEYVQRRPTDGDPQRIVVHPPRCLIRWDYVITIQSLEAASEPFDLGAYTTWGKA